MTATVTEIDRQVNLIWGFLQQGPVVVLTGAGLSTASGIPAYRDRDGNWTHSKPIAHDEFLRFEHVRRRYWARSFRGWPTIACASPAGGHQALAQMEASGRVALTITQNVDGLHQKAGSQSVLELHGGLQRVVCLNCEQLHPRSKVQEWMSAANPQIAIEAIGLAPDGDAHADESASQAFCVPACPCCDGILKPDVVFFGGFVQRDRVDAAKLAIASAHGLLVVGSSLMVYSGYRFAEHAHRESKPVMAINLGKTRADHLLTAKVEHDCDEFLIRLKSRIDQGSIDLKLY